MSGSPTAAICVLGCKPGSAAFVRRARAASEAFFAREGSLIVACGGRAWHGRIEADELRRLLTERDVPDAAILRERLSLDTRGNARFAAELLARRGVPGVLVVTCSWHLPRATRLFRAEGLEVEGLGVEPPNPSIASRAYWAARERVSTWKDSMRRRTRSV